MSKKKYAYYPGCSLHGSAREFDVTTRMVCDRLGVELNEVPGWTCCGASSAHMTNKLLAISLAARNLQIVEESGLPVTTPCPACYSRMKFATHDMADPNLRATVSEVLGKEVRNTAVVRPLLALMSPKDVAAAVVKPLRGLKVACYYGCALVRPAKVVAFDDEENPQSMDRLLCAAGAETVDWAFKTECCGAALTITRPQEVVRLSGRILRAAQRQGVDCVVVPCQMCHGNLDQRQTEIAKATGQQLGLPVLYFTQLLALAMGIPARELMFEKNLTSPLPMLRSKGLAE